MKPLEFLKLPNLLEQIVKTVQSQGVIGEDIPITSEIIIPCGKLVRNKDTTSTNLHLEDESSIGKDYSLKHVMKVVFYKDWIKFNSPTPTSISYSQRWQNVGTSEKPVFETIGPRIDDSKILYIKDASDVFLNGDDAKLLFEEEEVNLPKTLQGKIITLQWNKPVIIITTADTDTTNQLLRRCPSLSLNGSRDQTEKINDFQLKNRCNLSSKLIPGDKVEIEIVKEAFYLLKKVFVDLSKVQEEILKRKPKLDDVKMRTLYPRLLDYISFSAALYQYQRERNGSETVYANKEDVIIGFEIFEYIYHKKEWKEEQDVSFLNPRQQKMLERFRNHKGIPYTVKEVHSWRICTTSLDKVYRDIKKIMDHDNKLMVLDKTYPTRYVYDKVSWEIEV